MALLSAQRIRVVHDEPARSLGDYVLYWMTAARRSTFNFALQRGIELAREHRKPLLVFEPLRVAYPWACDRFHAFVLDGMADNAAGFARAGIMYYPYLEPAVDADKGLLAAMVARAVAVVADDYPAFFLPHLLKAGASVARAAGVRLEAVDSNGLLPLRATDQVFPTAYAFRRFLQRTLPGALELWPMENPLKGVQLPLAKVPEVVRQRWPPCAPGAVDLSRLPIDHAVGKVARRGGAVAASETLTRFLTERLARYGERSQPSADAVSELSPFLHFGQISVHAVLAALGEKVGWTAEKLGPTRSGQREGFWNLSPEADAFLDELVTWRELGFNFASHRDDFAQYDSLPAWARASLEKHASDPRPHLYTLAQLEAAATHDPLWNAAQRQLVTEGYMHNYLRMLWGKKVLQWFESPRLAAEALIHLNNKYELDGRDPNSYSGIFWVFGRYDRPWGPERPIFGVIRYMTSENTARKLDMKGYLARYGDRQGRLL